MFPHYCSITPKLKLLQITKKEKFYYKGFNPVLLCLYNTNYTKLV
ncbi:hypothetical protein TASCI_10130 [Tenacibaculum ascidiaceicola]